MSAVARRNPTMAVKPWRAADRHTGIGSSEGMRYTYQHVERPPVSGAECYRIECLVPFVAPTPLHRNVYYVPARRLDRFFDTWGDIAETVVDVRPLTWSEALAEAEAAYVKERTAAPEGAA